MGVRDLGERQSGKVDEYQHDRHHSTHNLLLDEANLWGREDQEGQHEKSGDGKQERGGVDSRGARAEALLRQVKPTDNEGDSEHKQQVSDDRSDQRGFHDCEVACACQQDAYNQLGDIAERRIQRPLRRGPTRRATWSVDRPMRPASGTMANADVMNTATV